MIWGILVVVIAIVGCEVDSWTVKLICAVIGGFCIMKAKERRAAERRERQIQRDITAEGILKDLEVDEKHEK